MIPAMTTGIRDCKTWSQFTEYMNNRLFSNLHYQIWSECSDTCNSNAGFGGTICCPSTCAHIMSHLVISESQSIFLERTSEYHLRDVSLQHHSEMDRHDLKLTANAIPPCTHRLVSFLKLQSSGIHTMPKKGANLGDSSASAIFASIGLF